MQGTSTGSVARTALGEKPTRTWTPGQWTVLRILTSTTALLTAVASVRGDAASGPLSAASAVLLVGATLCLLLGWWNRSSGVLAALGALGLAATRATLAPLEDLLQLTALSALLSIFAAAETPAFWSLDRRADVDPGSAWTLAPVSERVLAILWLVALIPLARGVGDASATAAVAVSVLATVGAWISLPQPMAAWAPGTALAGAVAAVVFGAGGSGWLQPVLLLVLWLGAFGSRALPPQRPQHPELLLYDGNCGLCHGAVRFLMAEDHDGTSFCFAPLGGLTFEERLTPGDRDTLPDSVALLTEDGRLLCRFAAVRHALLRLGGLWRLLDLLLVPIPTALGDLAYDAVARVRHRIFAKPKDACPLLPPALRSRMLP